MRPLRCAPTYLGRHVAHPDRYEALCGGQDRTGYFPAYRELLD